jgi:hypothetical protein
LFCSYILSLLEGIMDITVAYFHPFSHPEVVKRDFDQIRAAGATSIVCSIHEQEEQRWPRDLERGLLQAQDAGLRVHLSLGRYGNLFAGPALMPSWYTFRHPQSRVMDRHGRYHEISCYNQQPFRHWLFNEIEQLLRAYPVNGILLDEPRGLEVTCFCPVCRALCPDVADLDRFRRRSLIEFLGEVCACARRVDADITTTVVLLPHDLAQVEDLARLSSLDTLGCHLFWNILREDVRAVRAWSSDLTGITRQHGKRSQLWLQNFSLDECDEQDMETAFGHMMAVEPDAVACYYYWRNNANPARVWEMTRGLLKRVPRRQLHWQVVHSVPKAEEQVS